MSAGNPLQINDDRHGTPRGYALGCRDRCCTSAATIERRRTRARAKARGLKPNDPRHGTLNGYINQGCRCSACKAASAESVRRYRENLFRPA